jgi:hypothetical protein
MPEDNTNTNPKDIVLSLIGSIKSWEINYPNWVKPDPFYLKESPYG